MNTVLQISIPLFVAKIVIKTFLKKCQKPPKKYFKRQIFLLQYLTFEKEVNRIYND